MRLTVLREAAGFHFIWEPDHEPGSDPHRANGLVRSKRQPVDKALASEIEQAVDLAAATVDRLGQQGAGASVESALALAGAVIHARLLPPELRTQIAALPRIAALTLTLDEAAAAIPWELSYDGAHFLCQKLAIGRRRLSDRGFDRAIALPASRARALIVGNPTGDLEAADAEIESLMDLFDSAPDGPRCELLCRGQATRLRLLEAMAGGGYDILHYAGHARPGALQLADGWLEAAEIREALSGQPFVYLNACRSGRRPTGTTATEPGQDLTTALLEAGARAVIGTLWPIFDHRAGALAIGVYRALLSHDSLGEALRRARFEAREQAPDEAFWAAPVLHGRPETVVLPPGPSQHAGTAVVIRWSAKTDSDATEPSGRLHLACAEIAARGGRVARVWQSGLLAVFGVPRALEDDAARALETALAVRDRAAERPAAIGIASGRIDLDPRGLGAHALPLYAGPAISAAESLAKRANRGQALADEACVRLAGPAFLFKPSDMADRGLELVEGRGDARGRTPELTVGRERELDELAACLRGVRAGSGAVLGIVGDAGLGKSHLIQVFRADQPDGGIHWLGLRPAGGAAAFATVSALLHALDTAAGPAPAPADSRLRAVIDTLLDRAPAGERIDIVAEDIGRLLHWLRTGLARLASDRPIVIEVDDAHRLDEASLELLERLSSGIESSPVLLILLYRPGWQHPFAHKPSYRQLALGPLSTASSLSLVEAISGIDATAEGDFRSLIEGTGGNPFFIEECLRSWQETGLLERQDGRWTLVRRPSEDELPATVQRTLLARRDRLPAEARHALEAAAVLAEPFAPERMSRMLGGVAVEPLLEQLEHAGFVESRWASGELALRHALVGEVVSTAMQVPVRRSLHRRAAQILTGAGPAEAKEVESLARHALCAVTADGRLGPFHDPEGAARASASPAGLDLATDIEAEDLRRALAACSAAGNLALVRYAARRATAHLRCALAMQEALPAVDLAARADLQEQLGDALNQLGAFDAATQAYTSAFEMRSSGRLDAKARRQSADLARRIGRLEGWGARYDAALDWMARAQELLGDALDEQARGTAALIHVHAGAIHYYRGDLETALENIQRGLGIAEGTPHRAALATGQNMLGAVHDARGERDRAIQAYRHSLALWQSLDDDYQAARVADNLGITSYHLGDWSMAAEHHEQALAFFEGIEDRDQAAYAALNLGNVRLSQGEQAVADALFSRALAWGESVGSPRLQVMAWLNRGLAALESDAQDGAQSALRRSQELQSEYEIVDFEAETQVALGRLQLAQGDREAAEALGRAAIDGAGGLGLPLEEALARRLVGRARRSQADPAAGLEQLRWSLRILEGLGQQHEAARTHMALAEAFHAGREIEAAREALESARSAFGKLGAASDLNRVADLVKSWERSDVA